MQIAAATAVGIAGAGRVAIGLAQATAEAIAQPLVWARNADSAARVQDALGATARVTTSLSDLGSCDVVVEAVIEDEDVKSELYAALDQVLRPSAILMTTTSSLSVERLAEASRRPDRFAGLHVFTPVRRMPLIEVVFPPAVTPRTRAETLELCARLGKTAMVVPDIPGFIVNRLIFPFLFDAVRLLDVGGVTKETIDACVRLGAAHPMGPLALLDFVGLDVAAAIGEQLGEAVPPRITRLIEEGHLGRKSGAGLYEY